MGDPLSISAGVAGLLALGLTATEGLNTLIANFRGAPGEIKELGQELRNLRDLLERASSLHQTHGSSINDQRFASTFDEHVRACVVPIQQLDETLRKLSCRSSVLLRPLWAVKKGQVRDLRTRLRDAKASLSLMIVLFNGFVTGQGQEVIRQDIKNGFKKVQNEFSTLRVGMDVRERLDDELTSLYSGKEGARTDHRACMERFFATQSLWEKASAVDERPPTDAMSADTWMLDEYLGADNNSIQPRPTRSIIAALFSSGQHKTCSQLFEVYKEICKTCEDGQTPLHLCVIWDDALTLEVLLRLIPQIDVDACNARQETSLGLAVATRATDTACLLISSGASVLDLCRTIMLMQHHEDEALKAILPTLARRLNRSTDGPFMLNEAIRINQTGLMDMLLHAGFDPNKRDGHGLAPIHLAVKASNQSHAQALKDKGADIDAVCVQQDPDFYLPLVPEARLLQGMAFTPLLLAARYSQDQGMAFTPLLLAARYSQSPDMVRWLLKNGADPNRAIGSKEITVLHGMASSPDSIPDSRERFLARVFEMLIQAGADVNAQDNVGDSVLTYAIISNDIALARLLLAQPNIDIDHGGTEFDTPLHLCIRNDRHEILKLLLKCSPNLNLRSDDGRTAMQVARLIGDWVGERLLLNAAEKSRADERRNGPGDSISECSSLEDSRSVQRHSSISDESDADDGRRHQGGDDAAEQSKAD